INRYREFLARFDRHKEATAARYELVLSLLESPEPDYNGAREHLEVLAAIKHLPERPYVLYYLGLTQRGLAIGELAKEAGSPQPVSPNQARAKQLFTDAGKQFAAARQAFVAGVKEPPPDAKELPQELEWAARARCDEAEMQLRTLQPKAARDLTAPFLKDPL